MTGHRFIGSAEFAPGKWIGVALFDARGKNNGVVNGKEYFKCPEQHGLFVRPGQVQVREGRLWRRAHEFTLTHSLSQLIYIRSTCIYV